MPDRTDAERGPAATSAATPGVENTATESGRKRLRGITALSDWPLRTKVIAVFLLPTVAALLLAGLRIAGGFEDAAVYQRAAERITLSKKVASLVHEVQGERTAMAAWIVSGRPNDRRALDMAIEETKDAAAALRNAADTVQEIDDPETTELYKQAMARLDSISQLRASARDPDFPAPAVVVSYNVLIDALLDVSDQFGADVTDKGLRQRHEALSALAHAKEYSARQNAYLRNAAIRGTYKPTELQGIVRARSNLVSAISNFNEIATAEHKSLYKNTVSGDAVSARFQLQALSLQRARAGQQVGIDPTEVKNSSSTTLQHFRTVQKALLRDAAQYTQNLLDSVWQELIITWIVLIAALVLALALTIVVARSLLRPLRDLRANALHVAEHQLPEAVEQIMHESDPRQAAERAVAPVPVHSREEIGQLARAFDVVHGQAVRQAAEQALLRENVNGIFVNLSRRSQRLVERQLGVIDRLESDEQDPDQLASLFELDHLATRLRRNGESLLVLSGAGLAKSLSRPVPAADVLGAAVSEIEQYSRVEVGSLPQVAVRGMTVHDLVHLLAELFDNATYFSEPETKITVRAVVTRRKALAIQITDRGVGMSDDQIAEANERLADPPDLDVSVTRRMGLYVVARLAQRHGIEVRLRENEDIEGGVISRVVVPQTLLEDISVAEQSLTPPPANRPAEESAEHTAGATAFDSPAPMTLDSVGQTPQTLDSAESVAPDPRAAVEPAVPTAESDDFDAADPGWPQEEPTQTGVRPAAATPATVASSEPHEPAEPSEDGGLTPLAEPLSLDDLVAGTSAAGPYRTAEDTPEPSRSGDPAQTGPHTAPERDGQPVAAATADGRGAPAAPEQGRAQETDCALSVPREQPRYVPVDQQQPSAEHSTEATDTPALEDDVPTRRLPIYQSVLSRWFSEEEQPADEQAAAPQQQAAPAEQAHGAHAWENWGTESADAGWQAAESLWQSGEEEVTHAGLPKRVPNAYLVPGSAAPDKSDTGGPGFTDTTSGKPGQGAIARSADAARSRMMNFQRGYTKGRHALVDTTEGETLDADVAGERSTEDGVRQ